MILWGIQTGLFRDPEGVKVFLIFKGFKRQFNKSKILKRTHMTYEKAPEMPDPIIMTEIPTGKVIEPEDILSGIIGGMREVQPEDM